jgi:hypothetical protein
MQNIIHTSGLTDRLQLIQKAALEFAKPDENKSREQFLAEIQLIKSLLDEVNDLVA